jgi:hypothetical protein
MTYNGYIKWNSQKNLKKRRKKEKKQLTMRNDPVSTISSSPFEKWVAEWSVDELYND